jgi:hypothetical protein
MIVTTGDSFYKVIYLIPGKNRLYGAFGKEMYKYDYDKAIMYVLWQETTGGELPPRRSSSLQDHVRQLHTKR